MNKTSSPSQATLLVASEINAPEGGLEALTVIKLVLVLPQLFVKKAITLMTSLLAKPVVDIFGVV